MGWIRGYYKYNALHLTNVSASSHGTAIVNVAGNTSLNGNYTINNLTSDSTLRNNSELLYFLKLIVVQ